MGTALINYYRTIQGASTPATPTEPETPAELTGTYAMVAEDVAGSSINKIAFNGTLLLIGGEDQRIRYTNNFVNWDNEYVGGSVYAILWDSDSEKFFVGLQNGDLLSTVDGENYTEITSYSGAIYDIVKIGTRIYVLSEDGYAHYSDDGGETWNDGTQQALSDSPTGIAYNENYYLCTNENGYLYRSEDGATWEAIRDLDVKLVGVYWNGTDFIIFGNFGQVWASPDGNSYRQVSQLYGSAVAQVVSTACEDGCLMLGTIAVGGTDMQSGLLYVSYDGGYTYKKIDKLTNNIKGLCDCDGDLYVGDGTDLVKYTFS